ncbi:MAG: AbgT family transporter [Moraxellaceae bacterium]|nr:AbgT family transporter [Moraxellaceae bacterium]MDZ4297651.1 AbgT family transporter [Moraxellaceae bacterium]MDZ4385924.1 AbgT family transporter [Moraxellaceae bacterium]
MSGRWLNRIEVVGNRLPDPVTLFVIAIAVLMAVSAWLASQQVTVAHPGTGEAITAVSLLSAPILTRLLTDIPQLFAAFPPLGLVLVMMVGVGLAERSGLIAASLGGLARAVPKSLLTPTIVFIGVISSLAVDAGYVVVIPLAAMLFQQAGRHPLAGIAAAFAGVSAGFSANIVVTPFDALLAGLTEAAAKLVDPAAVVPITANYWLMLALVPVFVIVGSWLTDNVIEPRLQNITHTTVASEDVVVSRPGLWAAFVVLLVWSLLLVWLALPGGMLRSETGTLEPLLRSLVVLLFLLFALMGLAYGIAAGSIRSDRDAVRLMSEAMSDMSAYIVLALFAAIFLALFAWSNVGLLLAVNGANWLANLGFTGLPLLLSIVALTAVVNLFVGSASAKWALLAPVLVPMLMLLNIEPGVTQAAYRIGDASTNPITPLLPYFPLILIMLRRYQPDAGIGTLVALMLPYAIAFTVSASALFVLWMALDLPLALLA